MSPPEEPADAALRRTLSGIRDRILEAEGFPVPRPHRERLRGYRVRMGRPDEEAVEVTVEVRVRRETASPGSGPDAPPAGGGPSGAEAVERRTRRVEVTPEVVVDAPDGHRYFAGWNDVAEVFVVWFTDDALRALRRRREGGRDG